MGYVGTLSGDSCVCESKEFAVYAVIRTGSKQYKVEEGQVIRVEKLEGDAGAKIDLKDILLVGGNGSPKIGTPIVAGASVAAEILKQAKAKKVLVFKKKRRKGYQKSYGHRQLYTEIKITKINA